MILADVLSGLVEIDTDLLLAINGWRAEWADFFMDGSDCYPSVGMQTPSGEPGESYLGVRTDSKRL